MAAKNMIRQTTTLFNNLAITIVIIIIITIIIIIVIVLIVIVILINIIIIILHAQLNLPHIPLTSVLHFTETLRLKALRDLQVT